jgi:hypothetical protein
MITCGGGMAPCDFAMCTGGSGAQSCPRGVIVCNRECPM